VDTLINVALMIMLTVGFSFTFMMEGFPNFAHTSYAGLGSLVSFYLTRFFDFNPYDTWPFAALFGGLLGVVLYIGIVQPIRRRGGYQDITLTLTFIVIAQVLPFFYLIFNYWARYWGGEAARGYYLGYYDFNYNGIPGIAIISTAACILLIIGLRYFLTQNKIGLSLRAVAENRDLAATIGVNTNYAHYASWFISGALSSLVGSIMTIHSGTALGGPDGMIISVMSGAILGGVYNIYGAIIGGLFVALTQKLLNTIFFNIFGLAIMNWQGLFPLVFLILALFIFPNGVTGPGGIDKQRLNDLWSDVKEVLGVTREDTAS
jgi:branched-chain amino acid transport system permease protein